MTSPRLRHVIDSFLCLFVFFPSILMYWRGIWDLYGVYIYPEEPFWSNWAVFCLGCTTYFGFFLHPAVEAILRRSGCGATSENTAYSHQRINGTKPDNGIYSDKEIEHSRRTSKDEEVNALKDSELVQLPRDRQRCRFWTRRTVYVVVSRLYMYLYAVSAMAYWRGVWVLIDHYLDGFDRLTGALTGLVVSYTILVLTRTSRTVIFPPFAVALDSRSDLLQPSTRFNRKLFNAGQPYRPCGINLALYAADAAFSFFVVVTSAVVAWRSTITLYDIILDCGNAFISDATSALVGFVTCSVILIAEPCFYKVALTYDGWRRIAYSQSITLLQHAAGLFLWRGVWNLNLQYLITDPYKGGWLNHVVGTILLFSFQLFSIVGSCGCGLDFQQRDVNDATSSATDNGDIDSADDGMSYDDVFPTSYVRHYFRN